MPAQVLADKVGVVKSAMLFNVLKFTEIRAHDDLNNSDALVLATIGESDFVESLDLIKGKRLKNQNISVKNVNAPESLHNEFDVLLISGVPSDQTLQVLNSLQSRRVLTVSDQKGFCEQGGILEFMVVDGKVKFLINLDAANDSGIKISSRLARLAYKVIEQGKIRSF